MSTCRAACARIWRWVVTGQIGAHARAWWRLRRDARRLRRSAAFDAGWYRAAYPDVAAARIDPALHYLRRGMAEGRSPLPVVMVAGLREDPYSAELAAFDRLIPSRHSREGGNPRWQRRRSGRPLWIPAFAGMTRRRSKIPPLGGGDDTIASASEILVSVIVPTRDHAALLARCADSILYRTEYPAIELLIIDNDSRQRRTARLLMRLQADPRVRGTALAGSVQLVSDEQRSGPAGARRGRRAVEQRC